MRTQYMIRRAGLADLDRILEIERSSFGREAYDRKLFAYYQEWCGDLFLVSGRPGRVSGYMVTCVRGGRAELVSVAVDPACRQKGAASALLESTLRRLGRRGVSRLGLVSASTTGRLSRSMRSMASAAGGSRAAIMRMAAMASP